jgi:hypothetical protein
MYSRYGKHSQQEIETAARRFATANGYKLEVVSISGDDAAKQLAAARARIKRGGVNVVYGFSAGAFNADHLQDEFPELTYVKLGGTTPRKTVKDDIEFPGTKHMDQPEALAREAESEKEERDKQQARNDLDRAAKNEAAKPEVKLKVAVDAPAKTTVEARADGPLFKDKAVTVERKVQPEVSAVGHN